MYDYENTELGMYAIDLYINLIPHSSLPVGLISTLPYEYTGCTCIKNCSIVKETTLKNHLVFSFNILNFHSFFFSVLKKFYRKCIIWSYIQGVPIFDRQGSTLESSR